MSSYRFVWRWLGKDSLVLLSSQAFYKAATLVLLAVLARDLSKEDMGAFLYAAALCAACAPFTELGTSRALTRHVARVPASAPERAGSVLRLRLPLLALFVAGVSGGIHLFRPGIFAIVLLTALAAVPAEVFATFGAVFLGLRRVRLHAASGVFGRLLLLILVLGAVAAHASLETILLCQVAAGLGLVGAALFFFRTRVSPLRPLLKTRAKPQILRESAPLFLLLVLEALHLRAGTLVLAHFRSYSSVAGYETGLKLLEASPFLVRPVGMVLFPLTARWAATGDWTALRRLFRQVSLLALAAGLAVGAVLAIGSQLWIHLFFGNRYEETATILRILSLAMPPAALALLALLVAQAVHLERPAAWILAAALALNVALACALTPRYGARGTAAALAASQWLGAVCLAVLVFRTLRRRVETSHA